MANKITNASYYRGIQCFGEARIWCKRFTSGFYHYRVLCLSYLGWIAFHKSGFISLRGILVISLLLALERQEIWQSHVPFHLPNTDRQVCRMAGDFISFILGLVQLVSLSEICINTKPTTFFSGGNRSVHNTCFYLQTLSHSINNAKGLWDRIYSL